MSVTTPLFDRDDHLGRLDARVSRELAQDVRLLGIGLRRLVALSYDFEPLEIAIFVDCALPVCGDLLPIHLIAYGL